MTYAAKAIKMAQGRAKTKAVAALLERHAEEYRTLFAQAMAEEGYERREVVEDHWFPSTASTGNLSVIPRQSTVKSAVKSQGFRAIHPQASRETVA